jgi:hypothetical protein
MPSPATTPVYDTYWRWIAERQGMYERRLVDPVGPWTHDEVLANHRFTNVFRVSDRVSQRLVADVQYGDGRSQAVDEVFYRTIVFKTWNREDVWDELERSLGPISWQSTPPPAIAEVLDDMHADGRRVYSAAYIMPAPPFGHVRKHANHCALIQSMMDEGLPARLSRTLGLGEVYEALLSYPGIGRFLAFQYAIDLNYSSMLGHDESEFVVAGPGAIDGISKCFSDVDGMSPEETIMWMHGRQDAEFERLGIAFGGLFGRRPQPIDLQNCLCEISKYARVVHPEHAGSAGRTRIKQGYAHAGRSALPRPFLPPRWNVAIPEYQSASMPPPRQADLFG